MATTTASGNQLAGVSSVDSNAHYSVGSSFGYGSSLLLVAVFDLAASFQFSPVVSGSLCLRAVNGAYDNITWNEDIYYLAAPVADVSSVTFSKLNYARNYRFIVDGEQIPYVRELPLDATELIFALRNGLAIGARNTEWATSGAYPYIEVTFGDTEVTVGFNYASIFAGKIKNLSETQFNWAVSVSATTVVPVQIQSVKIEWRKQGDSASKFVDATVEGNSATVAAGIFPVGVIDWRVVGTANNGAMATSSWVTTESVAPTWTMTPSSGYVPHTNDTIFSWEVSQVSRVQQASAVFQWRVGSGGVVTSISIPGNTSTVTIPANTFPAGEIQWRVIITSKDGATATSDWAIISTAESAATAEALEPNGTVVESTSPILFRWSHIIDTGTAQTKAELQWSANKSTWTALATITGSAQSWTAPANTFTAGTRYWRVRTYNSDNVASSWSDAATFICVGAPAAPVVVIRELSPRPKISWQVEGQQAYQVELVGVYADGTRFGTDKQWQSPLYLADGDYTVRVRVQNEYGFWSAWGVAPLQIINTPGSAITLTAETGREVTLAWAASGFDYYIVYRDGTAVARTTVPLYTDRTSIGQVKYQVRGCYATSANYSLSDTVTVTVSTPSVCLYDLDAGQWVDLRYDASAHRSTAYSLARDIQYMQLSGRAYPVAERSEFLQRSLRVACVCFTAADRARMLSMLGHLVCVKTPEGNMVTGYIANLSETSDDFFSTYGFDVAQADVKEAIDIDEA